MSNKYSIEGKCMEMCPDEEIRMRESRKLLHILEMQQGTAQNKLPKADRSKIVKCFTRSAAGKNLQDPKILRPPKVLVKTVKYLLDEVINYPELPFNVIYDFIVDRLRAVRQDLIIQNVEILKTIHILQPIIRFHCYSAYRLSTENISKFDPFLNNKHLLECLKRVLHLYDDLETQTDKEGIFESRIEFESLYIILNLGNTEALQRAVSLKKHLKNTPLLKASIQLALSYRNGNFVRVCREIPKMPELLCAAASLKLRELQRFAFDVMSVAYNSKNMGFPIGLIKDMLLYNNVTEVEEDCLACGVRVCENIAYFNKGSFNSKSWNGQGKHYNFVDNKLKHVSLRELILTDF